MLFNLELTGISEGVIDSQREQGEEHQKASIQYHIEHEEPKAKMIPLNVQVTPNNWMFQ